MLVPRVCVQEVSLSLVLNATTFSGVCGREGVDNRGLDTGYICASPSRLKIF